MLVDRAGESMESRFSTQRVILPMSDAARASLASVQAAQEAARGRARRETRRTRAWLGGILGAIALGLLVFGSPLRGRKSGAGEGSKNNALATATAPAAAPLPIAAPTPVTAPAPVAAVALPAPGAAPAAGVVAASPAAAVTPSSTATPGQATSAGPSDGECAESFGQRRWRLSVEACTRAFSEHPNDAGIALRIAHAHHARARLPEAGTWANRALALDPTLAEAYVIVAHAERHAGNQVAAIEAYRHYLTLAPRGWHASEARAAVRAHAREKSANVERTAAPRPTAASASAAAPSAGG